MRTGLAPTLLCDRTRSTSASLTSGSVARAATAGTTPRRNWAFGAAFWAAGRSPGTAMYWASEGNARNRAAAAASRMRKVML